MPIKLNNIPWLLVRLLARLRQTMPLIAFLPGLMLGQLLGLLVIVNSVRDEACFIAAIALLMLWRQSIRGTIFVLNSGLLPGVLLILAILEAPPVNLERKILSVTARIDGSPRYRDIGALHLPLKVMGAWDASAQTRSNSELDGAKLLCKAIHLPWRNVIHAGRGDIVIAKVSLRPLNSWQELFTYDNGLWRSGFNAHCKITHLALIEDHPAELFSLLRARIAARIQAILGESEVGGLILSLTLGFRDQLSSDTERAFKRTGLAHLLVFSGYQVTLIFIVFRTLGLLAAGFFTGKARIIIRRIFALLALALACASVVLVEMESSALRAGMALIVTVIAKTLDRRHGIGPSILVSMLVLCVLFPGCFLDPGIQLTYAALAGFWLAESRRSVCDSKFSGAMRGAILASLLTSCVCCFWFGGFSLGGLILNPILAPLLSVIGTLGGLISIIALMTGIDGSGTLLSLLARFLNFTTEVVVEVSRLEFIWLQNGFLALALILAIVVLVFREVLKALSKYAALQGIA